ncbi:MAG: hypothetical protein A4S09_05515 [Proteobacteria bacterium SG_bin7]|nr:MAG: hypothetical protein A4S09_05515 [Proteobacteria bacterium SG_bin7]
MKKFRSLISVFFLITSITILSPSAKANNFGFRFSPILILVGIADVDLDIGLGSNFVLSPEIIGGKWTLLDKGYIQLSGGGLALSYHFNGNFTDGFYLGVAGQTVEVKGENSSGLAAQATAKGGGLRAGYLWQWVNFYMNLGASFFSSDNTKITYSDGSTENIPGGSGAGLDFKIGWSF